MDTTECGCGCGNPTKGGRFLPAHSWVGQQNVVECDDKIADLAERLRMWQRARALAVEGGRDGAHVLADREAHEQWLEEQKERLAEREAEHEQRLADLGWTEADWERWVEEGVAANRAKKAEKLRSQFAVVTSDGDA